MVNFLFAMLHTHLAAPSLIRPPYYSDPFTNSTVEIRPILYNQSIMTVVPITSNNPNL